MGRDLEQTCALCTPWGPAPKHLVQVELGKVCAALTSLVGQFGLLPRLSQEFRAPLSQWFEEVSAFLEGSSLRNEVWGLFRVSFGSGGHGAVQGLWH